MLIYRYELETTRASVSCYTSQGAGFVTRGRARLDLLKSKPARLVVLRTKVDAGLKAIAVAGRRRRAVLNFMMLLLLLLLLCIVVVVWKRRCLMLGNGEDLFYL